MSTIIQNRNDSEANWISANPTLARGEIGIEQVTNKFKIGDGVTRWTALPYASAGQTTGNGAMVVLDAIVVTADTAIVGAPVTPVAGVTYLYPIIQGGSGNYTVSVQGYSFPAAPVGARMSIALYYDGANYLKIDGSTKSVAAVVPVLSLSGPANVSEAAGYATYTVTLSSTTANTVSVYYMTQDGTATAGTDYLSTAGTLTIPAGQSSGTFTVTILNDTAVEAQENFLVTIMSPLNATLGSAVQVNTAIIDNDTAVGVPAVTLSGPTSASESAGVVNYTVTLNTTSTQSVYVQFATAIGTASAGSDFTSAAGTVTIPAGASSGTFAVSILNDTVAEPSESFSVSLLNPVNCTIATGTVITTIIDDDTNAPVGGMQMNLNATWANTWEQVNYFANLARVVGPTSWVLALGTGTAVTTGGKIQPSNTTSIWRAYLSDQGAGLPSGTYTVRWTGNGSLKLGPYFAVDSGWDTSGSFTFNYTKGDFLGVYFKGTNLTSLQVIRPNMVTSYDSGNEWNTEYLAWFATTKAKALRAMDWLNASDNHEVNWSERSVMSDIGFGKEPDASGYNLPYELIIDFANRANIDIWLNIPTRASTAYAASLASLFSTVNNKVYVEYGNEIWNTGVPWGDGTSWVRYLNHTRVIGVGASPNRINKVGHGLSTGAQVVFFGFHGVAKDPAWELQGGNICTITKVDNDNFTVSALYGGGTTPNVTVGKQYMYIVVAERNDTDIGTNYSLRFQALIAAMKPNMTRSKVYFVMGAQQWNTGDSAARMAAVVDLNDIDFLATAPYSNGPQWAARLNITPSGVTPQVSSTEWASTIHWGIYAANQAPTDEQVKAGTGIASDNSTTTTYAYRSGYEGAVNVSTLTNGASYKCIFVATHDPVWQITTRIEIPFTYTGTQTLQATVSNASKALLDELDLITQYETANNGRSFEEHIAGARGKPLIAYEGGPHEDRARPAEVNAKLFEYWRTPEYAAIFKRVMGQFSIKGVKRFFYYKDISGTNWGLSTSLADTSDARYSAFAAFNGSLPAYTQLARLNNATASLGSGAYPRWIASLTDVSGSNTLDSGNLTFEIISGNSSGLFSITGNNVMCAAAAGAHRLVIRGYTPYTVAYMVLTIS